MFIKWKLHNNIFYLDCYQFILEVHRINYFFKAKSRINVLQNKVSIQVIFDKNKKTNKYKKYKTKYVIHKIIKWKLKNVKKYRTKLKLDSIKHNFLET